MASLKPLASLTSTLLARKGSARPAMRPQGFAGFGTTIAIESATGSSLEDLGWNDMGAAEPLPVVAPIPPVLIEREALQEQVGPIEPTEMRAVGDAASPLTVSPISVATAARIGREVASQAVRKSNTGSRTAFTLRLEADRHLRLRLASAMTRQSSQRLVTQALDAFLQSIPEVEALIAQLPETRSVDAKPADAKPERPARAAKNSLLRARRQSDR